MTQIVEWAPFSLKEGVAELTMLEAADLIQKEFLGKQEGFIKRELLKGPNNSWVDVLHWESNEAAEKAMQNVMTSKACQQYFQCMADATKPPLHFEQAKAWNTSL